MNDELKKRISQEVSEFYESEGEAFGHTRHHVWELMLDFMSQLKSGNTLVDVGAGNARLLDVVPENISYIGIEPSSSLRQFAIRRLQNHKQARMIDSSLPELALQSNTADAITCVAVLHHVPSDEERKRSIAELQRILKPGGMMIISVWNLRAKRFFSWQTWKYAWLRLRGVAGGERGDLYYVWRTGKVPRNRYVHAFTLKEFKSLFAEKDWTVEKIGGYDSQGWTSVLKGRNLAAIVRKR